MANHRAERRTPSRRSDTARVGARATESTEAPAASVQVDLPVSTTDETSANVAAFEAATSPGRSGPGKRRAVKPNRAERSAARSAEKDAARAVVAREAAEAKAAREATRRAAREASRATKPAAAPAALQKQPHRRPDPASGGHTGGRKSLFPALPSAPSLVGAAALAIAAVGATVSQQNTQLADSGYEKFAAQASVLNSASSIGSSDAISGRQRAVSRDSERQTLQDAEEQELLQAAESKAKERDAALAQLAASAEKHAKVIARNLWQLPLPAGSYSVSHNFGACSYLWANCHTGEDLSAPYGTPIYSIAAGTVTEAGYEGSYGNKTVITLEDGTELWYCHQSEMNVSVGETVDAGQNIGAVGTTGNTTGPHLHLEVHPGAGDAVDPISALAVRGLTL